jgi:hypothetical protein
MGPVRAITTVIGDRPARRPAATMPVMEAPPAVWTVAPGADEDEAKDLLDRLATHLGIQPPQITNGMVMLPADYPRVANALDEVQPDWRDEDVLIPPVP